MQEADPDVQSPLHPARVVLGPLVRTLLEPGHREHPVDPVARLGAGHAVEPGEEVQVLARAQVGVDRQLLRHVPIAPLASTLRVVSARPATSTSPASGSSSPQTIEIVVVLRAPFGPSSPSVSPVRCPG